MNVPRAAGACVGLSHPDAPALPTLDMGRGASADSDGPPLRIAWVEEWISTLSSRILPGLAQRHEITYVTAGETVPQAPLHRVIRGKRGKYMNLAGFELSRHVNRLYRDGAIDMAVVWASIGFALRRIPFINLEGGSVYAQIRLFQSLRPFPHRLRYLPGLIHYAVPEMICNRRALKVIVPSESLQRDLMRLHHLPEHKVAVVPHGADSEFLDIFERKRPTDPPKILFVGRLHFAKGIVPVLAEFVRRPDLKAELLIIGDGPDRGAVDRYAAGDPRLQVLGSLDRPMLKSLMQSTSIFLFPSFYEGFGLALLEAMASGHACVTYDLPVAREVLGDCGIRVPLGDSRGMLDAVAKLLDEPNCIAWHAERAHGRALSFSWGDAREAIDQIIRSTLAVHRVVSAIGPRPTTRNR